MSWWDEVFPKRCVGCKAWGRYVCEKCEVGLWEAEQVCPGCGRRSRQGRRHKGCVGELEGLTVFWTNSGMARKLIGQVRKRYYFDYLSELMERSGAILGRGEFSCLETLLKRGAVVTPVPISEQQKRRQGFSSAEIVARWLVGNLRRMGLSRLLIRVKEGGEGKFEVKPGVKVAERVVLVDDVWKTGKTMRECARVLKRGGGRHIWGVALAR